MSDDNLEGNEGEGIASLRKAHDADKKRVAELEARLASFEKAERAKQAADVFKAKGLDEAKAKAAAKLYANEDVSEDAVGKWLDEYKDLFPVSAGTTENDANALNAARVAAASHGAADASGTGSNPVALGDPFEIARLLDTQPYEELQKLLNMPARNSI